MSDFFRSPAGPSVLLPVLWLPLEMTAGLGDRVGEKGRDFKGMGEKGELEKEVTSVKA